MASGSSVLMVDLVGRPLETDGLPEDLPVPGLLVRALTEAVKRVEAGRLLDDLDRDAMWAIEGFILDKDVLEGLPNGVYSSEQFIEVVVEAGFTWRSAPL